MRNVVEKFVEKIEAHSLWSVHFFFYENCAIYEMMWKNIVQLDTPYVTI